MNALRRIRSGRLAGRLTMGLLGADFAAATLFAPATAAAGSTDGLPTSAESVQGPFKVANLKAAVLGWSGYPGPEIFYKFRITNLGPDTVKFRVLERHWMDSALAGPHHPLLVADKLEYFTRAANESVDVTIHCDPPPNRICFRAQVKVDVIGGIDPNTSNNTATITLP